MVFLVKRFNSCVDWHQLRSSKNYRSCQTFYSINLALETTARLFSWYYVQCTLRLYQSLETPQLNSRLSMFQIWPETKLSTPQRTVSCQLCNQVFHDIDALNAHYDTAHVTRKAFKFFCRVCEKGYHDKQSLSAHEFSAHGVGQAPRKCRYCDERFLNSVAVKKHVKEKHPERAWTM